MPNLEVSAEAADEGVTLNVLDQTIALAPRESAMIVVVQERGEWKVNISIVRNEAAQQ